MSSNTTTCDENDIEEFDDSEEPCPKINQQLSIEVEQVENEEYKFLDGVSSLADLQTELYDVRYQLAASRSNGKYIPLKLYRSNRHNSLSVSDVQSGMWCERQLEYRYLYPHMKRTKQWTKKEREGREVKKKTEAMVKGSTIHHAKELEVHDEVHVKTVTREDREALKLINTYKQLSIIKEGKMEREIAISGDPFNTGILLNGIIDQVQYSKHTQELIVTDLKTRYSNSLPGEAQKMGHRLQLMVYKMLLDGITSGSADMNLLSDHLHLKPDTKMCTEIIDYIGQLGLRSVLMSPSCSPGEELEELSFGSAVRILSDLIVRLDLPPVSSLMIYYEYQQTKKVLGEEKVVFDEEWAREKLLSAVKFWKGEREPTGPDIEDLWKCNSCQFKEVCVWRQQKTLESSPAAKICRSP